MPDTESQRTCYLQQLIGLIWKMLDVKKWWRRRELICRHNHLTKRHYFVGNFDRAPRPALRLWLLSHNAPLIRNMPIRQPKSFAKLSARSRSLQAQTEKYDWYRHPKRARLTFSVKSAHNPLSKSSRLAGNDAKLTYGFICTLNTVRVGFSPP
jgi:hypothetical protein